MEGQPQTIQDTIEDRDATAYEGRKNVRYGDCEDQIENVGLLLSTMFQPGRHRVPYSNRNSHASCPAYSESRW
jgi:hypothetical protein